MRLLPFPLLFLLNTASAATPYVLNWSSQTYGPDGPWHAVSIAVGSNAQSVDLYPGANGASVIFMDWLCSNTSMSETCYAARAGTYNRNESSTAYSLSPNPWATCYWNVQGGCVEGVVGDQVTLGSVVIPNVSFTGIYQTYQTYPNGRSYPVSVGNLALGSPTLSDYVSNSSLNMIAAWLYTSGEEDNRIPSYSYGLHIGSVNPAVPGSLVLGGYDKSRVLGDVSAQSLNLGILQITLQDIGIGVAVGASPANFSSRENLFMESSGAVVPKSVTIDPTKPYMYLPEATCNAITASLPVSFDSGLGLFIWDTSSSDYTNITSSATYLSFTFNKNSFNNQNFTVKVPLALLTLTLQDPLVDQNATYFPCFYSTDTPVLGRAFLQAAFIGVNWLDGQDSGTWFIAQAPGPGLANTDITVINVDDATLAASNSTSWEDSWAGTWHPLQALSSGSSTSGLSTGAKAGIGVGVGIGGLILIAVGVWVVIVMLRRRRTAMSKGMQPGISRRVLLSELPVGKVDVPGAKELATKHSSHPREMMAEPEPPRYELD